MIITVEFLEWEIFKYVRNDGQINHKNAFDIIERYYCDPMNYYGFCPLNCSKCKFFLRSALEFYKSRNPGGLLVWKLRDKVARVRDAALYAREEKSAASANNSSYFSGSGNIFDDFLTEIEHQRS